jgi:hypothetical protein
VVVVEHTRKCARVSNMKKATKYFIIALWGIYEYLSLTISIFIFNAPISPMAGLLWLYSTLEYTTQYHLGAVIYFYFAFIIVCLLLGSLFFIAEKIENLRTRAIVSILFLVFVACYPVLLFTFSTIIR